MTARDPFPLPPVRGRVRRDVPLAKRSWLRVGGAARIWFEPEDPDDLAALLHGLPQAIPVLPVGLASNLLVRDGGFDGVLIHLGRAFSQVIPGEGWCLRAGAGGSDRRVASEARLAGIAGLEFLSGIPGTIGGAVRMNAGCFGSETGAVVRRVVALDRTGRRHTLEATALGFGYRRSALPEDWIVIEAELEGEAGDPIRIGERMRAIRTEREASQPLRVATGGSTFKNPPGARAWELIDAAGCRGLRLGRAMVSEKHCNFLINTGGATAGEIEALGEEVRARVLAMSGISLAWEIERIGRAPAFDLGAAA